MTSVAHQPVVLPSPLANNVDKVVQSVTNATKRLSQISTNTSNSSKRRKAQNKIGPWKLGRTLGRGSTGRVRLAKNVHTGKLAAVKIVPKLNFKKLENPKYKNNDATKLPYGIEREIIIMKLISHPNIMGLYDVWENKNDLYLILEYIEGGELFDYLIKRGKLLEFEAINYFKQIIHGIGYLHQFNICHRDLKPENLLLDFNKNIKIADFGMAALEVDRRLLETSCGSPHYASPEIVAGKNYHGAPSDIWSCGIILFALLTGHLPFDDENIRKLLLKVQNGKFIMPNELSWEAKDLISRMLQVNPNGRIPIEDILRHPLLTKYPDPTNQSLSARSDLILHSNIKPIQSIDRLDPEIVRNLCILFHNCPEDQIIKCLLSPRRSAEKMFYYLLMKYRNEHSLVSGTSNYVDDDTDLTASESKQTLPRSTSIVKTTVTAPTGEQFTTVRRISRSLSATSNASSKKKALANITNTSFTASSAHKRKTLLSNTVISKNNSTTSLKSIQQRNALLTSKAKPGKAQDLRPILRKLTPGYDILNEISAANDKENLPNERPKDFTITNFEKICHEVFGSNADTKSIYNMTISLDKKSISLETLHKLKILNHRLSKASLGLPKLPDILQDEQVPEKPKRYSSAEKIEKKLADEVQRINDARERQFQESDALQTKKIAEQRRQSRILQEKLREALLKISDAQNRNLSLPTSRVSSLDPRFGNNSLLRAKSLSARSSPSGILNEKNSKVLQKLGIDVKTNTPRLLLSRSSSVVKTSTSRNLAGLLGKDKDQVEEPVARPTLASQKVDDTKSIFSRSEMESSQQTLKRESTINSIGYRSMLNVIDEDNSNITKEFATIDERNDIEEGNLTRLSVQSKPGLIPNPRFSRISFNGLLNSKYDSGNVTIAQNTLSSGTVVKKGGRKQLPTSQGTGVIKKSPSADLPGLGISVHGNSARETTEQAITEEELVSFSQNSSSRAYSSQESSLQVEKLPNTRDDLLTSSSTMAEDYNLSDDLINMTQDFIEHEPAISRSSNIGDSLIQMHAEAGSNRKASGKLSNQSRETLVPGNDDSIKSMYKSYETLYGGKTSKQVSSSSRKDSTLFGAQTSFNAVVPKVPVLDSSSLLEDSQFSHNTKTDYKYEDKMSSSDYDNEDDEGDDELEAETSLEASKHDDLLVPQRHGTLKSSLRRSNASTQIFSSANITAKTHEEPEPIEPRQRKTSVHIYTGSANNTVIEEPIQPNKPGIFRRISLRPKREAPKAPEVSKWADEQPKGHNRFSGISIYSNARKFVAPKEQEAKPSSPNWFKRIFQSFSKSSKGESKSKGETTIQNRDVQIVDTRLRSVDLMRIIRNQLKLKEIEGSVMNVEIDEEFALISGVVPSRYARGRKLYFKIEIIDLVASLSLHLLKIKGSRTGFRSLVEVVTHVIKQEEEATDVRRSVSYKFSGHRN